MPLDRTAGTGRRRSTSTACWVRSARDSRRANDELDGKDRVLPPHVRMLDQLHRAFGSERSELLAILPDRGQGGMSERRRLDVVEADDGDVPARLQAGVAD